MRSSIQNSGFRIQKGLIRLLAFLILHCSFFIAAPAAAWAAPEGTSRFERIFADAARAYDENRLSEAIAGWESLLNQGQIHPEVLFNLGNAYYRNGQVGEAVRAYRHAQTLAPRDPDVRANLGFAAQSAGITLPARPPVATVLLAASRKEWQVGGSVCFWLLAMAFAAWILWPRFRFVARPAIGALAILLLVALAGLWMQRELRRMPECVVMSGDQKVRSSPLDSATPILAVPEGAIVRRLDQRSNWVEVEYESTRGWLPAAAVASVL